MPKIEINKELCKSCGLCVKECPKKIIHIGSTINSKGYNTAMQTDDNKCTGCKLCAIVCPDSAIAVYK
jgi:2-oxoglutarate ferredoxin oxidoreductase subunit delta